MFQKISRQQQHVLAALAQRRHHQRINAEPVVKVRPKAPGPHLLRQVAVGGGNHPHINAVLAVRAQPLQLPALQHAQQLGLHRQRQLAHFVQKQRAAIGQLELSAPVGHRARKRAAHMAKQLALHQRFRQRRAVQADQRARGAWRGRMQRLRHQFLADAGLAHDQHR